MWVLLSFTQEFRLFCNNTYTLGRKDCNFIVEKDSSISRLHANLKVAWNGTSDQHSQRSMGSRRSSAVVKNSTLTVEDKSTYGIWINDDKMPAQSIKSLKDGDKIRFGAQTSTFKVEYRPLFIYSSCISSSNKRALHELVSSVGGFLLPDWSASCQFLVMNSLSVTIKAISALVSLKPIVTPKYIEDYVGIIKTSCKPPLVEDYIPELNENNLKGKKVSFAVVKERQTLFCGKIFVFLLNKQFVKMSKCVELAGGRPMLFEEGCEQDNYDIFTSSNNCVLFPGFGEVTQATTEWILEVQGILEMKGLRMIPDEEIGYAVVFCSVKKFCNAAVPPVSESCVVPLSQNSATVESCSSVQLKAQNTQFVSHAKEAETRCAAAMVRESDILSIAPLNHCDKQEISRKNILRKRKLDESETEVMSLTQLNKTKKSTCMRKQDDENNFIETSTESCAVSSVSNKENSDMNFDRSISKKRQLNEAATPMAKRSCTSSSDVTPIAHPLGPESTTTHSARTAKEYAGGSSENVAMSLDLFASTTTLGLEKATRVGLRSQESGSSTAENVYQSERKSNSLMAATRSMQKTTVESGDDFDMFECMPVVTSSSKSRSSTRAQASLQNSNEKATDKVAAKDSIVVSPLQQHQPQPHQQSEDEKKTSTGDVCSSTSRGSKWKGGIESEVKLKDQEMKKSKILSKTRQKSGFIQDADDVFYSKENRKSLDDMSFIGNICTPGENVEQYDKKLIQLIQSSAFDPDLPSKCVQVEYTDSLMRKKAYKPKESSFGTVVMWNGRMVPNFKKFKKITDRSLVRNNNIELVEHVTIASQCLREVFARDNDQRQRNEAETNEDLFSEFEKDITFRSSRKR